MLWLVLNCVNTPARADVSRISIDEFEALAVKLSGKVPLFREIWESDPHAELFGGTTRDYLYWIKGQFKDCATREQALAKVQELEKLSAIDARDFIVGDSDVDVVTHYGVSVDAGKYGVRKIDSIKPDRFDPETEMGMNEWHQGFIPLEKIRLGSAGFIPWNQFGDGIGELYSGKPTLHAADPKVFAQTHYARQKLNHEVLIALRYLRILAINYYRDHGTAFPDTGTLFSIDAASAASVRDIMGRTLASPDFVSYLRRPQFSKWINQTVVKAFRSYTNPTATHELFKFFGADQLIARYPEHLDPINQYLFAKHRDPHAVDAVLRHFNTTPEKLYVAPDKEFSDGLLYHGTREEDSFRAILLQGIMPSTGGTAGEGLYGVEKGNIGFAIRWGGSRERLVTFKVKPDAKIIDITHGEGKRLYQAFGGTYDEFAESFGADILRYPYKTRAYVVKNSQALERPRGLTRAVLTYSKFLEMAEHATGEAETRLLCNLPRAE